MFCFLDQRQGSRLESSHVTPTMLSRARSGLGRLSVSSLVCVFYEEAVLRVVSVFPTASRPTRCRWESMLGLDSATTCVVESTHGSFLDVGVNRDLWPA